MARPKLNALPQDSVLRAHLRRQADWPDDAPRLTRREAGKRPRRDLLDAVDRIGRANHLVSQAEAKHAAAEALRADAVETGQVLQPDVQVEIDRLEGQATKLAAEARAIGNDGSGCPAVGDGPRPAERKKAGRPDERRRSIGDRPRRRAPAGRP